MIFSKRVAVDDVPRRTFFFAPRGEHRSLTFRVVVMEYRSMPTHVAAGRTLLDRELCKNVSIPAASDFRCFFELFAWPYRRCLTFLLKWRSSFFNFFVAWSFLFAMWVSPWKVSSSVSPSEIKWSFDVEANRHAHGDFALSVHKLKEGLARRDFSNRQWGSGASCCFHSFTIPASRLPMPRDRWAVGLMPSSSGATSKADLQPSDACIRVTSVWLVLVSFRVFS